MQLVNRTLLEGLVVTGHEVCFLQTRGKDRSLLCEGRMAMKMGISPDLGRFTRQILVLQPEGDPVLRDITASTQRDSRDAWLSPPPPEGAACRRRGVRARQGRAGMPVPLADERL